jgi:peptide/nickel transport system substrate-binding protein
MRGSRRGRRGSSLTACALAVALLAAACGGGGSSGGSTDTNASKAGGILRYGYDFDAQFTGTFDNSKSTGDCDQVITTFIYDTLLHRDSSGNIVAGLAARFQVDPPGNKVELWIRPGVQFSDGEPLDGQAVINGLTVNQQNDQLTTIKNVTKMELDPSDRLHVILTYKDDTGIQLPYALSGRDGLVMSTKSITGGKADSQPIGAGPFVLSSYEKGAKASLRTNPNYWDKANTYKFGGIDFIKVATGPPTVTAFEGGDIDFVRLETDGAAQLKGNSKYKVVERPSGAYLQVEFRIKGKGGKSTVFDNVKVRQAIEYALDRNRINEAAQQGLGDVTDQPFPKGNAAHVDALDNYYKYDPAKAKSLLTEAGYPKGFTFTMAIPGGGISNMEHQAVEVQQELKQVGIKANILRILPSAIATDFYQAYKGDAFVAEELASTFPGGSLRNNYATGEYVALYDGAERADITKLMDQGQSETTIPAAMQFVHQAVGIAVKQALDVPIAFAPQLNGYVASKVTGPVGAQDDICYPPDLSHISVQG